MRTRRPSKVMLDGVVHWAAGVRDFPDREVATMCLEVFPYSPEGNFYYSIATPTREPVSCLPCVLRGPRAEP